MTKRKFSLNYQDPALAELVQNMDHKILAAWAIACVERVLPHFEYHFPDDPRPRQALVTLQDWIDTGDFKMSVIRGAALASHAAAREVGEDTPARSAARAAGQAVASAHVPAHAIAAANYCLQAVYRAADRQNADALVVEERSWQFLHLLELSNQTCSGK